MVTVNKIQRIIIVIKCDFIILYKFLNYTNGINIIYIHISSMHINIVSFFHNNNNFSSEEEKNSNLHNTKLKIIDSVQE